MLVVVVEESDDKEGGKRESGMGRRQLRKTKEGEMS